MTKIERELDADRLVIWVSSFLRHSSFVIFSDALVQRAEDRLSFRSDFFPDKNQLSPRGLKRLQVPPTCDEIEQLRAIGEANETFRPKHARGQTFCKAFETIAGESFIGTERERFEIELMLMLRL